jgi:hypothetical protein
LQLVALLPTVEHKSLAPDGLDPESDPLALLQAALGAHAIAARSRPIRK